MIVLIAKYHVKPGNVAAVLGHLREMSPKVAASEPGCRQYQVAQSNDNENLLVLVEHYVDEAALAAHREMPHFKDIIEGKVVPLLDKREREILTLQIG